MKKVVHVSNAGASPKFSKVIADLGDVGDIEIEKQADELYEFLFATIPSGLYERLVARIMKSAKWYKSHPNDYIDLDLFLDTYFPKGRKRK